MVQVTLDELIQVLAPHGVRFEEIEIGGQDGLVVSVNHFLRVIGKETLFYPFEETGIRYLAPDTVRSICNRMKVDIKALDIGFHLG